MNYAPFESGGFTGFARLPWASDWMPLVLRLGGVWLVPLPYPSSLGSLLLPVDDFTFSESRRKGQQSVGLLPRYGPMGMSLGLRRSMRFSGSVHRTVMFNPACWSRSSRAPQ